MTKKIHTIISCFYDKGSDTMPIGFSWANTLVTDFTKSYKVTILLHGENLQYGLKSSVYESLFGTPNPYEKFLADLYCKHDVKIVICQLCLTQKGYNDSQLLDFVKPIAFSIDYLAKHQANKKAVIVYDAQLNAKSIRQIKHKTKDKIT